MSAHPDHLLRQVARLRARGEDDRGLRLAMVGEIRRHVSFDAYVWVLTDPRSWVGSAPLADVPCLPELLTLIRLKYGTALNRWTVLPGLAAEGRQLAATLHATTEGHLERSLVWRDLLSGYGVVDVASLAFVDHFGCWAFLDLWRSGGPPFDEGERVTLATLVEPLATALRECQMRALATGTARRMVGPAVLLLGDDLQVLSQTDATRSVLDALNPPGNGQVAIPAAAYNVAAQLRAVEAGVDGHDPSARVHLGDGLWLTLSAARIHQSEGAARNDIAVAIETTSADDRLDLHSRCFGLTPREGQLLRLIASGADTRTVARILLLSEYTVQDHLKSVFAKTGVRSRSALLAQVRGPVAMAT